MANELSQQDLASLGLSAPTASSLSPATPDAPAAPAAPAPPAELSPTDLSSLGVQVAPPAAAQPYGPTGSPETFVKQFLPEAQRVGKIVGVSPAVLLGQWGLETGWGRSIIPGTNNLGNIKDFRKNSDGVTAVDNQTGSRDAYRKYPSVSDYGDDFSALIGSKYQNALRTGDDAKSFFSALKAGGYAEDSAYVQKGVNAAQRVAKILGGAGATDPSLRAAGSATTTGYVDPYSDQPLRPKKTLGETASDAFKGGSLQSAGLGASMGALVLNTLGTDVAPDLRDSLIKFAEGKNKEAAELSGPNASFTDAIGPDGDLGRWGAYAVGYLGYQVAEAALTGGFGGLIAKQVGKAGVRAVAGKMVEREMLKLGETEAGKAMTKEAIAAMAAGKVAQQIGAGTALFANNLRQEGGSIYSDALEESKKTGKPIDLGNIWLASLAASGVDTVADLSMAKGVLGLREGSTAASYTGRLARELPKNIAIQGGTEGVQTVIEQAGAGKEIGTPESIKDIADSAAIGALGGAGGSMATAIHKRTQALAPVAAAAAEPGGVLSRAAMAGNTPEAVAAAAGQDVAAAQADATANAPAADPLADRTAQVVSAARAPGVLDALRAEGSPVAVKNFVDDMAVAQSPSAPAAAREKALSRLEFALGWAGQNQAPQPSPGIDAAAGVAESAARSTPTTPQQRQAGVDRDKALQGQAAAAPTEFDRQQALAQAQVNREQRMGAPIANNNQGTTGVAAVPGAETPAEPTAAPDLAAAAAGAPAPAAPLSQQELAIRGAMKSIEQRQGVASPAEAKLLADAGMGTPYDRIDESIQEGERAARQPRERVRYGTDERALEEGERLAAQERANARGTAAVGQTQEAPSAPAVSAPPRPDAQSVLNALAAASVLRSAEQRVTIQAAERGYSPADMQILRTAAASPFNLTASDRVRLDALRAPEAERSADRAAAPAAPAGRAIPPGAGTAMLRKRKATLRQLVDNGFSRVERRDDGFHLLGRPGQDFKLDGPADAQLARAALHDAIRDGASSGNTNPTDAQKEVNNYKLGRVEFDGLKLGIENPIGSERSGTAPDGTKWSVTMKAHYGDVTGTTAADGDAHDVYLVDSPRHGAPVFVIDQYNDNGKFDETKTVLGVATKEQATAIYDAHFSDGSGPRRRGAVTQMTMDQFKDWIKTPASKKPASGVMDRVAPAAAPAAPASSTFTVRVDGKPVQLERVNNLPEVESLDRGGKAVRVSAAKAQILDAIAQSFGKKIQIFKDPSRTTENPGIGDGFILPSDTSTIYINESTGISPIAVFGHELTHLLKADNPEAHAALEAVVAQRLKSGAREQQAALGYADENVLEEITSDLGGDLMSDPAFWRDVLDQIRIDNGTEAKGIIARFAEFIYRAINNLSRNLRDYGAEEMVTDMTAVREAFKTAMAGYLQTHGIAKQTMQAEIMRAGQQAKRSATRVDPNEVSTRAPWALSTTDDPIRNLLLVGLKSSRAGERAFERNVQAVIAYPNYRDAKSASTTDKKAERFIDHVENNLLWLYDGVSPDIRDRSHLWYDGANAIASRLAPEYDLTKPQVSGVMAVLSPQKDWFMNVDLARRVIDIARKHGDERWSKVMTDTAARIYGKPQYEADVQSLKGKTLNEIGDPYLKAMWLRAYDEAYNTRQYDILSPEGDSMGRAKNLNGAESKVAWGDLNSIAKAISIIDDGSLENVSARLGSEHKVRNFYNNILVPNSPNGHVTIDTHAVAAGLLRPLSGSAIEVLHNFGGAGSASSAIHGTSGTYGLYAEAYRRAAAQRGVLPREMQSITWEAVRGLFPAAFKSQSVNVNQTAKIWDQFKKGRLSLDDARKSIIDAAGGIAPPEWYRSGAGSPAEAGSGDARVVPAARVPGRRANAAATGGRSEFAGASANDEGRAAASTGSAGLPEPGDVRRSAGRLANEGRSDQGDGRSDQGDLTGLPKRVVIPGVGEIQATFFRPARDVAQAYMRERGVDYTPPTTYAKVDPERATRIADAYDALEHNPRDPEVQAAYRAMIDETLAQYDAIMKSGLRVDFIVGEDPYLASPRLATEDVRDNNHMWILSTRDGFGSNAKFDITENPMLEATKFEISGKKALVNDIFRVVHDYFGHVKDGIGFRADGEENAWRSHAAMYSPLALRAMTTETRGQNSWVNYGPMAERNRTATSDTIFADQKVNLLPEWVSTDGATDEAAPGVDRAPSASDAVRSTERATISGEAPRAGWERETKFARGGRPVVVFRGANTPLIASSFQPEQLGVASGNPSSGLGVWFTPSRDDAARYGDVERFNLDIRNPRVIKIEDLPGFDSVEDAKRWADQQKADGYDGIYIQAKYLGGNDQVVAFEPRQVISTQDAARADGDIISSLERKPIFYSQLERVFTEVPQRLATQSAPQWALWLKANAGKLGVKQDEIEWSGVLDYLKLRGKDKVTSDELSEYMRDNGVKVGETVMGERPLEWSETTSDSDGSKKWVTDRGIEITKNEEGKFDLWHQGELDSENYPNLNKAKDSAEQINNEMDYDTKYESYSVPGGENYREVLITLPSSISDDAIRAHLMKNYGFKRSELVDISTAARQKAMDDIGKPDFKSNHWTTPNILAHLRVDDRLDSEGGRVLFVNEIQSDWGQKGKKEGFGARNEYLVVDEDGNEKGRYDKKAEAEKHIEDENGVFKPWLGGDQDTSGWSVKDISNKVRGIPSAPFVQDTKSWVGLAMKRAIMMAVNGGYDKIAFIKGKQAADLYDLSNHIDRIDYNNNGDGTYNLSAIKGGTEVFSREDMAEADLEGAVGKEVAQKMIDGDGDVGGPVDRWVPEDSDPIEMRSLSGLDLKVGGEGMHAFYDQIVPQVARDVLKKVGGGSLGDIDIAPARYQGGVSGFDAMRGAGIPEATFQSHWMNLSQDSRDKMIEDERARRSQGLTQPGFDITPKMREAVDGGVPLFSKARDIADTNLMYGYKVGDLLKSSKQVGWWDRTVGSMFNMAEKHAGFKRVYDGIQTFLGDVSKYATRSADMAPSILPKLETLADIKKMPMTAADTKALSAPIFEGTLLYTRDKDGKAVKTDDVGSAGVVWKDEELRSMFDLDDKQIGLYREARRAINKSLADLAISDMVHFAGKDIEPIRDAVLKLNNIKDAADLIENHLAAQALEQPARADVLQNTAKDIRAKANAAVNLIAKGYAPLSRFGDHTVYVTRKNGDEPEEQLYFGMFESGREANKMEREMRDLYKDDPNVDIKVGTMSKESYKLFSGITPDTLSLFASHIGLEESGDKMQEQVFQEMLKVAKTNRSAMKRLIERKGVSGFSEDVGRVLAGFVYSNARQASTNLHVGAISKAAADIDPREGDVKDHAVKLIQYVNNPQEEAQALRGLLFVNYIGGSVASALVNLTQSATTTWPVLSQHFGIGKASAGMANALEIVRKGAGADQDLADAMKRAEEEGITAPQETHSLQAQAAGRAALRAGDGTKAGNALAKVTNAVSKAQLVWGKMFGWAEQVNRKLAFTAAYKLARDKGMEDPYAFAKKIVAETQYVMNKGNVNPWARGPVGATLFTFRKFMVNYLEGLARMWGAGPEGKKAFALSLGVLFIVAGAGGLPFAEDLDDLIDFFAQRVLNKSWSTKQAKKEFFAKIIGNAGAEFVSSGVSGLPGAPIDVSGRMGLGNIIPGTGLLVKKRDHSRDVAEIAGAGGDFVTKLATAVGQVAQGNLKGAAEQASPIALANVYKAIDMARMGEYRDFKGRKVIDTTLSEAILKGIGFQAASVKNVQDATAVQRQLIDLNKMRETEIADMWSKGRIERNADLIEDAKRQLKEWNESNPSSPITIDPSQITKRVQEANKTKAQRIAATAPKEIRKDVKQELEREGAR